MKFLLYSAFLLLVLGSCDSKKEKLMEGITKLQLTTDSVQVELKEIDSEKVVAWYADYSLMKQNLISFAANDTVPVEISEAFDSYMTSVSSVELLPVELEKCKSANNSLKVRLNLLKSDIENQKGDRSSYKRYLQKEEKEANSIRKHSQQLKEQYLVAESANTQFLPVIERFIRKFVIQ